MTIAQFEAAQWVLFFVLVAVVFVFQIPDFVCKSGWGERFHKRIVGRQYKFGCMILPWYGYTLLILAALIASALGNGFVWSDLLENTVANPSESNSLLLVGLILVLISYASLLFWTYLFIGKAFPRFTKECEDQKEHICAYWLNWSFGLLTVAFALALTTLILYWIATPVGWSMLFYPLILLIMWIAQLFIVLDEHNWEP